MYCNNFELQKAPDTLTFTLLELWIVRQLSIRPTWQKSTSIYLGFELIWARGNLYNIVNKKGEGEIQRTQQN